MTAPERRNVGGYIAAVVMLTAGGILFVALKVLGVA